MWKLMKILGFEGDDDYDDYDEGYGDEPARPPVKKQKPVRREPYPTSASVPRLVLFKGVPSERMKRRLREAMKEGAMILLDLHELNPREFDEEGLPFITFMSGVAYARGGCTEFIEPAQYLVTPHEGMYDEWFEEEPLNDGAFDRQGR